MPLQVILMIFPQKFSNNDAKTDVGMENDDDNHENRQFIIIWGHFDFGQKWYAIQDSDLGSYWLP